MPQRRLLIAAYYFPPIGGIGSIRMARFAELLPEFGWEPTVLTPRYTPHAPDPNLHIPNGRVVRSRSIEPSGLGRLIAPTGETAGPSGTARNVALRDLLRGLAHRFVLYPDPQIGWYPGAVTAGRHALRQERFDAIYSSSHPITAHLVARTLSRRARLPWIAEFRDPWHDRLPPNHPHRKRAARLEARIAREATRVIFPSPTWAEHYGALWGVPVEVVPNGYDELLPAGDPPERPTLTHLGTFYPGLQDLSSLWDALRDLRASGQTVPAVRFIGSLPDPVRASVEAAGLADVVEVTGFIPHDEAMRTLASSSMLVASGFPADAPATRGWVPAKLFDYLASDLPILYLADRATDGARMLAHQPGCFVVEPGDSDGVTSALKAGLEWPRQRRDIDSFSRRARTQELASVIDEAVSRR